MAKRIVEIFKDGVKVGEERYLIPPEIERAEALHEEFNSIHEQALLALANWPSLTLAQKDAILKNLLRWALWKDGWLKGD